MKCGDDYMNPHTIVDHHVTHPQAVSLVRAPQSLLRVGSISHISGDLLRQFLSPSPYSHLVDGDSSSRMTREVYCVLSVPTPRLVLTAIPLLN